MNAIAAILALLVVLAPDACLAKNAAPVTGSSEATPKNPATPAGTSETQAPKAATAPGANETQTPKAATTPSAGETQTPKATTKSGAVETQTPKAATGPGAGETQTPTAAAAAGASAAVPLLKALVSPQTARGNQVNIDAENLPDNISKVQLCPVVTGACFAVPADEATSKTIKFHVPPLLKPGTYRVRVALIDGKYLYSLSQLEVTRPAPVVAALSETALYPAGVGENNYADIQIYGSGFAGNVSTPSKPQSNKDEVLSLDQSSVEKNTILIDGIPLSSCFDRIKTRYCSNEFDIPTDDKTAKADKVFTVKGIPRTVFGKVKLSVQVENETSNGVDLLLSPSSRYAPRVTASAVLLIVVGLALLANRKRVDVPMVTPTAKIRRWETIFVDFDSNTYSLSRLQLVIWTFVALFGWVYLSVARSLIQGMVTFSDIPSGLPGVLAVSVGTSVAVGGISAVKGGKSSGPFSPAFSDFYSVGGIVAPERAQFLLWTIVGAAGFVVYTLALDPATIQDLPKLPDGFLQLAGISAAGYVGGKVVRKTGPKLTDVKVAVDQGDKTKSTWTVTGAGLAKNASFAVRMADTATPAPEKTLSTTSVEASDDNIDSDPAFYKRLGVHVNDAADAWTDTAHAKKRTFVIINPDGQRAEWPY
jgi:hypothetical protein